MAGRAATVTLPFKPPFKAEVPGWDHVISFEGRIARIRSIFHPGDKEPRCLGRHRRWQDWRTL